LAISRYIHYKNDLVVFAIFTSLSLTFDLFKVRNVMR